MHTPFVGQFAHGQATGPKAQHHEGVGQGCIGPRNTKFFLHFRQHHRHHIHAAATQRHEKKRDEETAGGVGRVDEGGVGLER